MNKQHTYLPEKKDGVRARRPAKKAAPGETHAAPGGLQHSLGNRSLQRLVAQRAAGGSAELDDATAARINAERGGGQALDAALQEQAGAALGADFSAVRVHTTPEADALNQQINAKAFTTGQDIFFRQGAYQPGSAGGQELIAHELAHVVQQSRGAVGGGGGKMTVNPPGDRFEQEADAAAVRAVQNGAAAQVQRQAPEEDKEVQARALQRQEEPEDEELQTKALQRQPLEEEEEEPLQGKLLQRRKMEAEGEPAA